MIDQRNRQVTILGALKDFCTGVADYKGYTTVAGYWKPMIVIIPVILILFFMFFASLFNSIATAGRESVGNLFGSIILIVILNILLLIFALPNAVRRLRDVGFNSQGILVVMIGSAVLNYVFEKIGFGLLSTIISIVLFILSLLPSDYLLNQEWAKKSFEKFLR